MLKHGAVPHSFTTGIIIPVIKDKHGDHTNLNNYRGITLSSCFSKLFELCLIQKFSSFLSTSDLQFGFKKKIGCSHAIYAVRSVVDFYCQGGSTVNAAMLDMSKAFDRVNHTVLFHKLMQRGMPPVVLQLLMTWYKSSNAFVRWNNYVSSVFSLSAGVRQGGVLSPLLFNVYVDNFLLRMQSANLGCRIGSCYLGCVMYADDLTLISASLTDLQRMIDICVNEAEQLSMQFNAKKCSIIRFGPRYAKLCSPVTMCGSELSMVSSAKYLGIMLLARRTFATDIQYNKSAFYRAFNGIFHCAAKFKDELVMYQLIASYCKPYLLYATEALNLNVTQRRSLGHTWQCAVSRTFNVSGDDVTFVCNLMEAAPFSDMLLQRSVKFMYSLLTLHHSHTVLGYLSRHRYFSAP